MSEQTIQILLCSPDAGLAEALARTLGPDFEVQRTAELTFDAAEPRENQPDLVLLDFRGTNADSSKEAGPAFMREVNRGQLPPPVVAILGEDEPGLATRLIEVGAYDTVTTPLDIAELRLAIRRAHKYHHTQRELFQLRSLEQRTGGLDRLVGSAPCMEKIFALARKIAPCDVNVLVTGETGTGKELLARAIHKLSPRAGGPFVALSCANLPDSLVEDELFGHEKGAFTGALTMRRGGVEAADRGTLFLDEIGDLGLGLQPKLLRVLQERTFTRLGSNTPLTVDIRVVCATHRNLETMVQQNSFREDLYYRLNVVQLRLPPLRERRDDIPVLAHFFLQRFAERFSKKVTRISPRVLLAFEDYPWPGNVRELENVIQRATVLAEGSTVEFWHLPAAFHKDFEPVPIPRSYEDEVRDFKRRLILRTLRECGWRKAETARTLGLARAYLHRLINQLEIREEEADAVIKLMEEPEPAAQVM